MTLIARRRELAAVRRLLDRVAAGAGGHLIVTGPSGSGKTALLDVAGEMARARGIPVLRTAATDGDPGQPIWSRMLGDLEAVPDREGHEEQDLERLAGSIARGGPRLLLIDDVDRAGPPAVEFLAMLVSRLGPGPTVLIASSSDSVGMTPDLRLRGLTETELAGLMPGMPPDAVHAVWLASGGLPGSALALTGELSAADQTDAAFTDAGSADAGSPEDPVTRLALSAPSRAGFLDLDVGLIRLLETAAERPSPPATRARVLARLARELLGDPSAAGRRRELIGEAVASAQASGSPGTIAEVLDSRLHALWDPSAAHERLTTASQIVEQARLAGDADAERRGLFWRFIALAELGDLEGAEAALTAYARTGELTGDAEAAVVVLARQSMLATVRGRFDTAAELAAEVSVRGRQAGLADTDRLVGTLRSSIDALRGDVASYAERWQGVARRLPGHFFEATAARALAESGRVVEAGLELERLLPAVLAGSGPRWIGVVADLAIVASRVGEPAAAEALYGALLPYRGRVVVWGGANTITGPVDDYLGRLAARLGRTAEAVAHFGHAVELEERIGALPWLAHTLVARAEALAGGDRRQADDDLARARSIAERLGLTRLLSSLTPPAGEWRLTRDGDGWRLDAGPETVRLRDGRGVHYLRTLLTAPGQEVAALDLVAGGAGLVASQGEPVLDGAARAAYRRRLRQLDEQLDGADRAGDAGRAAALQAERTALLAELRRATGLGGRPRTQDAEAERARVNATRALWAIVERVESAAPGAGAHLRASLRSGRFFRYQPAPGGPDRWSL
ncbi:AAA family ATPase [Planotetraspora thailandica]|uniref:ATP-binding protein n=1 Tax=Planotetraspora thailandica TaxID=487172 RepID=UPI00194EFD3F|nr:ATP-binding protein [Planotetraspora thailandica]